MKKSWWGVGCVVALCTILVQPLWAAPKVVRIGQVVATGHIENLTAEKFREIVEPRTDLKVQVYPGGNSGNMRSCIKP